MSPTFDQLSDHDFDPEEDEIDFSDLQERYEVHMEQGLDTFVVGRLICFIWSICLTIVLGHRWTPCRQRRTETQTHQVPDEEINISGQDKRC